MAVGLPLKTTYADGDVYSASDVNDTNGTINITAAPYAAGKNKIINGDFFINQRNFTSNTVQNQYGFDRWTQFNGGATGTLTITPQTFTLGAAPVAGYESKNFVQCVTAAGASVDTYAIFAQKIESVRTLAGQTATVSFWAKATSGTPKIGVELYQSFGGGGSPSADVSIPAGAVTISTSWARYSVTVAVPSISGKTIGTNNDDSFIVSLWLSSGSNTATRASSIGLQNATFQIWGVQIENGSTATAFQTATGTIQGELAACQRYFQTLGNWSGTGWTESTTVANLVFSFPVKMRIAPAFTVASTLTNCLAIFGVNYFTPTTWVLQNAKDDSCWINTNTFTGLTSLRFCASAITIGSVSAEL
jgi:hypothetical protein